MQRTCIGCIVVYVILADIILTFAAGPSWDTLSSTTITLDSTTPGVCDDVTALIASSTDGSTVAYSIQSQTPDGGFGMFQSMVTYIYHLTCTVGSINAESYTVVVSARHNGGNNEESLLTLTIVFSNLADAAGPSWDTPSSTTITLDSTTPGVCDDVTALIASSTDGSTIAYSIQSQTPNGGFDTFQNTITYIYHLTCTAASINAESYTVVVSARHDGGNNEETLLTLTIVFSNFAGRLETPSLLNTQNTPCLDERGPIYLGDAENDDPLLRGETNKDEPPHKKHKATRTSPLPQANIQNLNYGDIVKAVKDGTKLIAEAINSNTKAIECNEKALDRVTLELSRIERKVHSMERSFHQQQEKENKVPTRKQHFKE